MIRNRRAQALGLATLAVAGLTVTGAGRALADGPGEANIFVSAPGSVVRGDNVDLAIFFDTTSCYGDDDSAQWNVDGTPLNDSFEPTDGDEVSSGPGVPAGDYMRSDEFWDSTAVSNGQHTATLVFSGTDCTSGAAYTETRSLTFTVDNSPIGIQFSRSSGSTVSGTSVPLSITTTDPHSSVDDVEWSGGVVKRTDGDRAILDTAGRNGRQTITVTVTDDADVTTNATLTLNIPTTTRTTAASGSAATKHKVTKHKVVKHKAVKHKAKKHLAKKHLVKHTTRH